MDIVYFYQRVSDLIDSVIGRGPYIVDNVSYMKTILSLSEIAETNVDRKSLEKSIDDTAMKLRGKHIDYDQTMVLFVSSLNKIIARRYNDLNSFLIDNNIYVGINFANISEYSGYIINSDRIRSLS